MPNGQRRGSSARPKWQEFERLGARIFSELSPTADVKWNDRIEGRYSKAKRQIDVAIRADVEGRPSLTIVQARDKGRPAHVMAVDDTQIASSHDLARTRQMPRMRVRLLGTGGATNEARHQASLLVDWCDGASGAILLDTGSGMEIVRRLTAVGSDPAEVRAIFVSHQHVDHVGGLEPLLLWSVVNTLRQSGHPPRDATRVYAEARVLASIERLFGALATAVPRLFAGMLRWHPAADGGSVELGNGTQLTTFLVDHEPAGGGAMGCVVARDGVRLVYSGDTRPTRRLIEAARGADVLIHESGGLDEHAAEVHRLGHSTGGDAGRTAKAAGVGRLILTHLPADGIAASLLAEARAAFGGPVELACDLTVVDT